MDSPRLLQLTAHIVAAFAGHNHVRPDLLPGLISSVFQTLNTIETASAPEEPREPAVPVRASIKPDHLVCLECGAKFASLRRHLKTSHELSPEQYREHWGLRPDYPMVAPSYSARRSEMAKRIGLGARRQRVVEEVEPPAPPPPPVAQAAPAEPVRAPARRGRAAAASVAASPPLAAPEPAAPAPLASARPSPTAETVFANFKRADANEAAPVEDDETSEESVAAALTAKGSRRKPFAKQPSRTMRATTPRR